MTVSQLVKRYLVDNDPDAPRIYAPPPRGKPWAFALLMLFVFSLVAALGLGVAILIVDMIATGAEAASSASAFTNGGKW